MKKVSSSLYKSYVHIILFELFFYNNSKPVKTKVCSELKKSLWIYQCLNTNHRTIILRVIPLDLALLYTVIIR